jgi:hypothetical protein
MPRVRWRNAGKPRNGSSRLRATIGRRLRFRINKALLLSRRQSPGQASKRPRKRSISVFQMVFVHSSSGCFAKVDGVFATRTERAVLCRSDHVTLRCCSSVFSTIVRTWLDPIFAVWRRATSRISWWRPGHFINAKKLRRFVRLAERSSGPMTSWQFMRHSGVLYFRFQTICYSVIDLSLRSRGEALPDGLEPITGALDVLADLHRNRNRRPIAGTVQRLLEATRAYMGFA